MEKLEEGKTLMPAGYADLRRDYADNRREERNEAGGTGHELSADYCTISSGVIG